MLGAFSFTEEMVNDLSAYKGKSSTACPSPADWLEAFADAEQVFCVAITSSLSGSCNAAEIAKLRVGDLVYVSGKAFTCRSRLPCLCDRLPVGGTGASTDR